MRKLKLQMQISLDGFVATTSNEPVKFGWDDEVRSFSISNLDHVDTILLGSKTAQGFIPHWASVAANEQNPDYRVGKLLTDIPKIVFSKSFTESKWANAAIENGNLADAINQLKQQNGNDMMVYGGSGFVSSLIDEGLIDEYHLLVNPVASGSGMAIFKKFTRLKLIKTTPFGCGTVLLQYSPA